MIKIGLIDYYLDQFHALYYPKWLKELTGGELQVTCAWAKTDRPEGKTNFQCSEEGGFALLDSIEKVVESCDGLIVMSPDHAEMHEELCRLPLSSGKPTYVDKTFSASRAAALRMIEQADKAGTPFFSTSALRYATEYAELDKADITFINSRGPGYFDTYSIHQLEPIICMMGTGVKKILYTGSGSVQSFILGFLDGRAASMTLFGSGNFAMTVGYNGKSPAEVAVNSDFYMNFVTELSEFFHDRRPRVDTGQTLMIMTILEYGAQAMKKPGQWVTLP